MAKKTKKVTKRIDALSKARERYTDGNSCGDTVAKALGEVEQENCRSAAARRRWQMRGYRKSSMTHILHLSGETLTSWKGASVMSKLEECKGRRTYYYLWRTYD